MHLCLTVECITSGLHLSVFKLGHPPPPPWGQRENSFSPGCWVVQQAAHLPQFCEFALLMGLKRGGGREGLQVSNLFRRNRFWPQRGFACEHGVGVAAPRVPDATLPRPSPSPSHVTLFSPIRALCFPLCVGGCSGGYWWLERRLGGKV